MMKRSRTECSVSKSFSPNREGKRARTSFSSANDIKNQESFRLEAESESSCSSNFQAGKQVQISELEMDQMVFARVPAPEMDKKTLFKFLSISIANKYNWTKKSFTSLKKDLETNHEPDALRAIYIEQYRLYRLFIHLTKCFPNDFHYNPRSMLLNAADECWRDPLYFAGYESLIPKLKGVKLENLKLWASNFDYCEVTPTKHCQYMSYEFDEHPFLLCLPEIGVVKTSSRISGSSSRSDSGTPALSLRSGSSYGTPGFPPVNFRSVEVFRGENLGMACQKLMLEFGYLPADIRKVVSDNFSDQDFTIKFGRFDHELNLRLIFDLLPKYGPEREVFNKCLIEKGLVPLNDQVPQEGTQDIGQGQSSRQPLQETQTPKTLGKGRVHH